MALTLSNIKKPINRQVVDPFTGIMREEWEIYFSQLTQHLNSAVGELGSDLAPGDAEFIVSATSSELSAERVATDTATIDYDAGTAGQAKWNVLEVPGIASTGLVVRTAAATYVARTLTGPAAGISVSNGDGVSGNPTLVLANDLAALEALDSAGIAVRTGADTWAQRALQGGAGITISNPAGISGDPTIASLPYLGRRNISDITSGDTIIGTDQAKLVSIASGTGTLAFTAVGTLGAGFWCVIKNSGTGNVTLNPDGGELIDGLATWVLYPGGAILVECDGSALYSVLLSPMCVTFDSSGSFVTPGVGTFVDVEAWGPAGSGARGAANVAGGGGGGGGYKPGRFLRSQLGATETVTVGAGGASQTNATTNGNPGATNTTFGALLTAYLGGGGVAATPSNGGGGGGLLGQGGATTAGGAPTAQAGYLGGTAGAGSAGAAGGANNLFGGAAGGNGDAATGGAGGAAVYGGAGGGAGGDTTAGGAGGASLYGGAGGAGGTGNATGAPGTQPGGGGGGTETANSGAGADGRVRVRVW